MIATPSAEHTLKLVLQYLTLNVLYTFYIPEAWDHNTYTSPPADPLSPKVKTTPSQGTMRVDILV